MQDFRLCHSTLVGLCFSGTLCEMSVNYHQLTPHNICEKAKGSSFELCVIKAVMCVDLVFFRQQK